MSTLNEEIDFNTLPVQIRDSFVGHQAKKELFHSGTTLIRIVTLGHNSFSGAYCLTPVYFEHIKKYAELRKISLQSAVRETLALPPSFSPSPNIAVSITLGANVYGFVGQASSQNDQRVNQYFSGGCQQIFMPNLSKEHSNKFGLHHSFYGTC